MSSRSGYTGDLRVFELLGHELLAVFLKLGGTWDMAFNASGHMAGTGNLDDIMVRELEERAGVFKADTPSRVAYAEQQLGLEMWKILKATEPDGR